MAIDIHLDPVASDLVCESDVTRKAALSMAEMCESKSDNNASLDVSPITKGAIEPMALITLGSDLGNADNPIDNSRNVRLTSVNGKIETQDYRKKLGGAINYANGGEEGFFLLLRWRV